MRLINKALLRKFHEAQSCEYCSRPVPSCDAAHVFSRGAGRLDISCNLISLCRGFTPKGVWISCHQDFDAGVIDRESMLAVVAAREKCLQEDIERVVRLFRHIPKWPGIEDICQMITMNAMGLGSRAFGLAVRMAEEYEASLSVR